MIGVGLRFENSDGLPIFVKNRQAIR